MRNGALRACFGSNKNVVSFIPEHWYGDQKFLAITGAVKTVGKPERIFAEAFPSSCGNHQEEVAAGHRFRFPQLRQSSQRFAPRVSDVPQKRKAPGWRPEPL